MAVHDYVINDRVFGIATRLGINKTKNDDTKSPQLSGLFITLFFVYYVHFGRKLQMGDKIEGEALSDSDPYVIVDDQSGEFGVHTQTGESIPRKNK